MRPTAPTSCTRDDPINCICASDIEIPLTARNLPRIPIKNTTVPCARSDHFVESSELVTNQLYILFIVY